MNEREICEKCSQKTKRPAGFWDGENGGGLIYDCDSMECPIAIRRRQATAEQARRQAANRKANAEQFINATAFRAYRIEAQIKLKEAADMAGITSAQLSAYENEREPFPKKIYIELMTIFLNSSIVRPSTDKFEHK